MVAQENRNEQTTNKNARQVCSELERKVACTYTVRLCSRQTVLNRTLITRDIFSLSYLRRILTEEKNPRATWKFVRKRHFATITSLSNHHLFI